VRVFSGCIASGYRVDKLSQEIDMKLSALLVVLIASLIAAPSFAQSEESDNSYDGSYGRGPRGHRGPPPEAVEACDGKANGDECSFTGRDGEDLEGVCGIGIGGGAQIACRPKHRPGESERRPRPRDEKGEE